MKKYPRVTIAFPSVKPFGFLSTLDDPLSENSLRHGVDFTAFSEDQFDPVFYRIFYKGVSRLDEESLLLHWQGIGKKDKKLPNLTAYLLSVLKDENEAKKYLSNIWFYRAVNSDLQIERLCDYRLLLHYFNAGKNEGRFFLPEHWFADKGVESKLLLERLSNALATYRNNLPGTVNIDALEAARSLIGFNEVPVDICFDKAVSSRLYTDIAVELLKRNRKVQAQKLLHNAIYYGGTRAYELLGNIYLDHGNPEQAAALFEASIDKGAASEWAYKNLGDLYVRRGQFTDAANTLRDGIKAMPESQLLVNSYRACLNEYWHKMSKDLDGLKLVPDRRDEMVRLASARTNKLFGFWSDLYSIEPLSMPVRRLNNPEKVLIIGDFHLGQCIRYRINQKLEQLELHKHSVETVSWTELASTHVRIPYYDVVIFYRVPAVNEVVEQVAALKALGKVVIFEVDDQIFLPSYPVDLESYGGSIGLNIYSDLIKGMALNNAAVKLFDYSIASTNAIDDGLLSLTGSDVSYVHRNGLDKLNWFETKGSSGDRVRLFYGSGTLAHNADFIELALPAIVRLLDEFDYVDLVVMGHLTLPEWFCKKYDDQIKLIPKVDDVRAYSVFLSQADINMAVLLDDEVNGGKSELKWFEAACFQVPSVLSSTKNYRDVIKHGKDAFLAETPEDWYQYLHALVVDESLRTRVGVEAQKRVQHEYSVKALGAGLSAFIKSLALNKEVKKKPKICLVNVFFPPQSLGGATRVVADNFDVLVEQYGDDFDLCVFTSEANHAEPYRISAYSYKGVRVYKSTILFRENMDWHPKDAQMYDIFKEFLELEKPDKVHFHCVQRLTASVVEATRDLGIPYIVTAHDAWWISDYQFLVDSKGKVYPEGHPDKFDYSERVLPNNVSLNDSVARDGYLKQLINDAESVLTVSESFAEIYRKNGVPEISVTKNGISSKKEWKPKDTSYTDKVVCAHIGGMSTHKGYDLFKETISDVQPENIEVLVVDHSKSADYVSVEYWEDVKVTFIGRQQQDEIVDLYGRIDVLFAPSIWPESFGLVTREAVACGCWVVASNLGGIGEDVSENNGFRIESTTYSLKEVLSCIDSSAFAYKAPSNSSNFRSVEGQVQELIDVYQAKN